MVEFRNLTAKRISYGAYKKLFRKIFKKSFELSVVFASPGLMKKLNMAYRGKNKTANVLSFELEENIGEIFLNVKERKLLYLFLHGALHLQGYTHANNKDAIKMENLENKLLNK